MRELIQKLEEAILKQRVACATNVPADAKDVGYHFGRLQGVHVGLKQALEIVVNYLSEEDDENA